MYLSFNHDKKIAFGWSPKSGCTYLKRYLLHLSDSEAAAKTLEPEWLKLRSEEWSARERNVAKQTASPLGRWWFWLLQERNPRFKYFLYTGPSRRLFKNRFSGDLGLKMMLRGAALSSGIGYQRFHNILIRHVGVHNQLRRRLKVDQTEGAFDAKGYKTIFFVRNPYHRLVSGFLFVYAEKKEFHKKKLEHKRLETIHPGFAPSQLLRSELTFEQLINEMIENEFSRVDGHHFLPQTGMLFRNDLRFERVFDLQNIDHRYLAQLFGRRFIDPYFTKTDRDDWHQTRYAATAHKEAWRLSAGQLSKMERKPPRQSFYNPELKAKVEYLYRNDFALMREHGVDYQIEPAK